MYYANHVTQVSSSHWGASTQLPEQNLRGLTGLPNGRLQVSELGCCPAFRVWHAQGTGRTRDNILSLLVLKVLMVSQIVFYILCTYMLSGLLFQGQSVSEWTMFKLIQELCSMGGLLIPIGFWVMVPFCDTDRCLYINHAYEYMDKCPLVAGSDWLARGAKVGTERKELGWEESFFGRHVFTRENRWGPSENREIQCLKWWETVVNPTNNYK